MYTADWNSIKLSAAYTFTWMESAALSGSFQAGFCDFPGSIDTDPDSPFFGQSTCFQDQDSLNDGKLHQIGGSIMHKPSGLGIFGQYAKEETGGSNSIFVGFDGSTAPGGSLDEVFVNINTPDTDTWYVKPFWRKVWSMNGVGLGSLGATTIFGEWGQYNDQFNAFGGGLCDAFENSFGTNIESFCNTVNISGTTVTSPVDVFVTGSEVERWGLGVVQEIDAAAMHLYARWQHQDISLDLVGISQSLDFVTGDVSVSKQKVGQGFDDWDLFQVGGVIFF